MPQSAFTEPVTGEVARTAPPNEWFLNTLYSRLNDKCRGAIIIIIQRLHEDDLVGHVLGQEPWEVVCFPAIAEADEVHEIDTIWGPQCLTRRPGEALHPAREPLATLAHPPDDRRVQFRLASISNPRRRWAAAWSRPNGSSITLRRSGRRASSARRPSNYRSMISTATSTFALSRGRRGRAGKIAIS